MSDQPNLNEIRSFLWSALAERALNEHQRAFKYFELVNHVSVIAQRKGYTSPILPQVLEWRLSEFLIELINSGIVSPGAEKAGINWNNFRMTESGVSILTALGSSCYDPDGYIANLAKLITSLDPVIMQYAAESVQCFRRNIQFACAVMLGAAAEKTIYLLFDAIIASQKDPAEQQRMKVISSNANLPKLFNEIGKKLESLITKKTIPYDVHQGCVPHLLSLFEIVRVQRNECVHPTAPVSGELTNTKLVLCLNTFPYAVQSTYRLIGWLRQHPDSL